MKAKIFKSLFEVMVAGPQGPHDAISIHTAESMEAAVKWRDENRPDGIIDQADYTKEEWGEMMRDSLPGVDGEYP